MAVSHIARYMPTSACAPPGAPGGRGRAGKPALPCRSAAASKLPRCSGREKDLLPPIRNTRPTTWLSRSLHVTTMCHEHHQWNLPAYHPPNVHHQCSAHQAGRQAAKAPGSSAPAGRAAARSSAGTRSSCLRAHAGSPLPSPIGHAALGYLRVARHPDTVQGGRTCGSSAPVPQAESKSPAHALHWNEHQARPPGFTVQATSIPGLQARGRQPRMRRRMVGASEDR